MSHEIELQSQDEVIKLLGMNGELRKHIQDEVQVRIVDRGTKVVIVGGADETRMVGELLSQMLAAIRKGHTPTLEDIDYALSEARVSPPPVHEPPADGAPSGPPHAARELSEVLAETTPVLRRDLHIRPRTRGQRQYLDTIDTCDITLAIGPAGTGKTYLAMAAAVSALVNKQVKRLVLTRPAVEAGENLGFLPGDIEQKVNPYLRPLYDALYSMVDVDRVQRFIDLRRIEVAPLAFMRGRTLDQAFIILDEAQNTTTDQMLMFLTRLGQGSRAVITGDITQIDLPKETRSGLVEAQHILRDITGIGIVHLTKYDVVRNPLVQRVIDAYEAVKPAADGNQAQQC